MSKQDQFRDDKNLENRGQGKTNVYYLSDLYICNWLPFTLSQNCDVCLQLKPLLNP